MESAQAHIVRYKIKIVNCILSKMHPPAPKAPMMITTMMMKVKSDDSISF